MGDASRFVHAILAFSLSFPIARAADWPAFRGPDSNPVSMSKLPDRWSPTENIEWAAPIPGRGWSSPIVIGKEIFLTTVVTDGKSKQPQTGTEYSNEYVAELTKQGLSPKEVMDKVNARDIEMPAEVSLHYFLYCLDLDSGKEKWKREFYAGHPPGGRHRKNSFVSETPVTDGKLIYVYVASLGLWAYDLKGAQAWHTALESYPVYLDFGTAASPVLLDNMLVIVNDNQKQQFIASFDKRTGKQIWRTERDLQSTSGAMFKSGWVTPYIWKNPVRTEIVTIGPGVAVSYDTDGKELWRLSGMAPTPIPSPFAYDGLLYINGGHSAGLYAIKPGGKGDLTPKDVGSPGEFVAWSLPKLGTYLPTEVAYEGALYVLGETGILSRVEAKTGKVSYRSRLTTGGDFTSSPWAYDGKIFCLSEEGQTFVVAAGEKFELLRTNTFDEMALATPAIVGDRLLLRTESKLYSIRNKK